MQPGDDARRLTHSGGKGTCWPSIRWTPNDFEVRRRRTSAPEDEIIRISTELRRVQEDISYYSAWLFTESRPISEAYEALILKLREIAGREIQNAWNQPPIGNEAEMNISGLGLGRLKPFRLAASAWRLS